MKRKTLTEDQVRARLNAAIEDAGSQLAFAAKMGLARSYVCDIVHGRRELSNPAILAELGVERITEYREV